MSKALLDGAASPLNQQLNALLDPRADQPPESGPWTGPCICPCLPLGQIRAISLFSQMHQNLTMTEEAPQGTPQTLNKCPCTISVPLFTIVVY